MNKKIQQLIGLMNDNYTELHTILSGYSVKELEDSAMFLERACSREHTPEYKLLELLLTHRKWKLDAEFVYTPTAIEKILRLDDKLMDCQEKLCKEAEQELVRLQQKKQSNNAFYDDYDYEVECKITPYIFARDTQQGGILYDAYDGIDEILSCIQFKYMLHFSGENREQLRYYAYFKEKLNWNECDMPSQVESADFYISWGMHELCGHSLFSLSDILRINYLGGETKTIQQHFIKL
ncbi:MAG: hypothetical protein EZS26_000240 [Candidatus Ordinivivax streblomastigis]|uniref:Uncharacterized protein n=1 Tax=Candidatus Ordinivivax streblomastigis TaxID=2540710 RepID=A0A5M8P591_9BACT|nr:MAG: hypothetical protein EZS26_000240 [Candidatus Ordinivivax streblomastigis]